MSYKKFDAADLDFLKGLLGADRVAARDEVGIEIIILPAATKHQNQ